METEIKKPGRPKKAEVSPIESKLDELLGIVQEMDKRIADLERGGPEVEEEKLYQPKTHVPNRYLEIVLAILGPKFGIEAELSKEDYGTQSSDQAGMFHIIVPEEYSTLNQAEQDEGMRDLRPIVVIGEDDLQTYCEKVRNQIIKYHQNEGKPLPVRGFE